MWSSSTTGTALTRYSCILRTISLNGVNALTETTVRVMTSETVRFFIVVSFVFIVVSFRVRPTTR
jgi:hypothetical protein